MRPSFFWDVTQRRLVFTDVYERPVGPIFKGQDRPFKTGPTGCSETFMTNNPRRVTFQKNEGFTFLPQRRSDKLVLSKRRYLFTNYLGQFQKTAVLSVTAGIGQNLRPTCQQSPEICTQKHTCPPSALPYFVKITELPSTERLPSCYHNRRGTGWKRLFVFVCLTFWSRNFIFKF